MPRGSIPTTKVVAIALVVVGAGLIYWAYQLSDSLSAQLTETFSGSMPEEVMIRYIAGAACLAVGAFLYAKR